MEVFQIWKLQSLAIRKFEAFAFGDIYIWGGENFAYKVNYRNLSLELLANPVDLPGWECHKLYLSLSLLPVSRGFLKQFYLHCGTVSIELFIRQEMLCHDMADKEDFR